MCRTAWDYVNAFLPPAVHTHHHRELSSLSLKLFLTVVYPIISYSIILFITFISSLSYSIVFIPSLNAFILACFYHRVCDSYRCSSHFG